MRVIAGTAKGKRLASPKSDKIRPVLDQVKEAIFNILFDVSEKRVLDLFAGTGGMGIEALSRGADFACFVDNAKEAVGLIRKNLEICQMTSNSQALQMTAGKAIAFLKAESFDLIFVDPPYEQNYVNKTLKKLAESPLLYDKTLIIVEHHPKEPVVSIPGLRLTDQRKYGQTLISFLRKQEC